jgi:DNA polymerase-3 subunit epsilon
MPAAQFQPMVFVDLETTGSTGTVDRITEIGIVEIHEDGEVRAWSTLVNPQANIPSFIQSLTGITNEMVAKAPTFAEIADEVLSRLHGRLFVAHNARFDYGFLKNEFKRLDLDFKAPVLCTVKLSRKLFPQYSKHNLDALVERHNLHMPARHRALADADVLRQFWQVLQAQLPPEDLAAAVGELTGRSSWPVQLDPGVLADLPERHGVYLFYGDNELPLYIGKANNIRQRILAHFQADHRASKEMSLAQQVCRLEWIETPGELGALLKEAQLIKQWQPTHNRRLRRSDDLCTWRLRPTQAHADEGGLLPELAWARDLDWAQAPDVYGLFNSQKDALKTLREIAEQAQLCMVTLGLDKVPPGRPCFGYQLHQCSGVCMGEESQAAHAQRLRNVMADWQVKAWPYEGPVMVREGQAWHVLHAWCYLGTAQSSSEVEVLLKANRPRFDKDTYKILVSWLPKSRVEAIASPAQ